jgi:hypothetical protein
MSFTFARSGSVAQFESSPGTPIVPSELFFRRFRETRIELLPTLPFAVPIQAQIPRLSLRVPSEIWQHGSLFTPSINETISCKQVCCYGSILKCWVGRPGGNNAVDKA